MAQGCADMLVGQISDLTNSVKEFARHNGADLVGVAPVSRFENAPSRTSPAYYLSDATCVVSVGIRMGDPVVENVRRRQTVYSYLHFVNDLLFQELDALTHSIVRFIGKEGHDAYPIPALNPYHPTLLRGDLSHKHAAVAAGLGQIGWNNLFLSPAYGPRQVLSSVVTNAPLEEDSLFEGKLCDPVKCGYRCAKACYVQAISIEEKDEFSIGGRRFEHGKHIKWRCLWGCGSLSAAMPMPKEPPTIEELRIGRVRQQLQSVKKSSSLGETLSANLFMSRINDKEIPWCWVACMAVCPVGRQASS